MHQPSTLKILRDARKRVIRRAVQAERAGDAAGKVNWELRRAALDRELERLRQLSNPGGTPRRLFVSYSVKSGLRYFRCLETLLTKSGFEIRTGFQDSRGTDGNVLKIVLSQLHASNFYLGILSKEIPVQHHDGPRWAPGVWVSEEKGMALAVEKPFLLMIHRDIHEAFWQKTTPDKAHVFFDDDNFEKMAEETVARVAMRFEELLRDPSRR